MLTSIVKRDGSKQEFKPSKINGWGIWAAENLGEYVDWSSIVMHTVAILPDNCTTQEIQERLIKTCLDQNTWSYNLMAGRLYASHIKKHLYGKHTPTVKELHTTLLKAGLMVQLDYTDEEYRYLNDVIDHSRDQSTPHYALHQIREKYSLKNKVTKQEYETQQFVFMRMAMALAEDQPKERKIRDCISWYNHFSFNRINAPTPNYVNLGTPMKGYASCALYATGDNAKSLAIGDHIAYTMTYMSAGIGSILHTRSVGDPVRAGAIIHQGKLPYYRSMMNATKANMQNGRGGACTTYFSIYDPEAKTLNMLQNPKTTEDKRIRGMDYAVISNKFFARKVARKENIFTFNAFTAPDLYQSLFEGDESKFETLYKQYEENVLFNKNYVSARELLIQTMNQGYETGRQYLAFMDEANRHTPFKDKIYSSNLCVSGETLLLTDKGYFEIKTLQDRLVNVWNGTQWSETRVVKTGESQKLLKVVTDSGIEIDCTPYHKFYTINEYGGAEIVKEAKDLSPGDRFIKFKLPVIEGQTHLENAYINGFYTGDGCLTPQGQRVYLYHAKKELMDMFPGGTDWRYDSAQNRLIKHYQTLRDKFYVPTDDVTVQDKLNWLAGYSDADGSIYRNKDNQQLVLSSINFDFLKKVQLLLTTLGVSCKIKIFSIEGMRLLPKNDGSGENGLYLCKNGYRLIVPSNELQHLVQLGFSPKRLRIIKHEPQRQATKFVKVRFVLDLNVVADTYCVNEPLEHKVIFNGLLTGNCTEIFEPTAPYSDMKDLYTAEDHGRGEIALCSLGSIVAANVRTDEEHADAMYYTLLMIDKCIKKSEYMFPHLEFTAKSRLNAGVGITGLAHLMAKKGHRYTSPAGKEFMHTFAESHAYHAITQSIRLGKELGNAPWIHKTKWPEGWIPLDTYNKNVDSVVAPKYKRDWAAVKATLIENKGMRFSCLISHMPTESSSKASATTNSLYPIRDLNLLKSDNTIITYWSAPDGDDLGGNYQLAWDIPSEDLIEMYAIFQKFADQGISADMYRKIVGNDTVSSTEMISLYLKMVKLGMKSRYYQNTLTTDGISVETEMIGTAGCGSGGCSL